MNKTNDRDTDRTRNVTPCRCEQGELCTCAARCACKACACGKRCGA